LEIAIEVVVGIHVSIVHTTLLFSQNTLPFLA
jgi:hypothetical protein